MKLPIYITDIQPEFVKINMAKSKRLFWVAPVEKAAQQIFTAIENKKYRAYICKRWWLIAKIMRGLPMFIYKKIA